jgi:hypothetical protein
MNIQLLGIGSNLHTFADDERQERRQYPRVELRFALWWLKDLRGSEPVPGRGIEISGGGLQFLLHQKVGKQCSLAFEINGRRMRASVDVLHAAEIDFEGRPWQHYRAKFVGLMEADYDFIVGFAQRPVHKLSIASHQSYDMLPAPTQAQIVAQLVGMKRLALAQPASARPYLAAHYTGVEHAKDGTLFHRFFIRSHMQSQTGAFVFNTEVLISDDGAVKIRA